MMFTFLLTISQADFFDTPRGKSLLFILFIIAGIIIHWAYEKWIVPDSEKESEEYKRNKYKNVDGC